MRLKIWEKWKRIILLGTFFVLVIGIPWEIRAENATVTFGSNYYTATDNETFPIGVYLNGDSKIGTYEVKISYDNRRLEYTGGGDSEENGVITLSGTGANAQVKYMLKFQTRSGGTADIKIESAVIHTAGENEEEFDVATLASTYVTISGEDTVGDAPPEESQETETGEENPVSDIPTVMEVPVEEQTYYLVDLSQYTPENIDFQYDTGTITYQGTEVAAYLSANGDISFVYLADSQKNLYLYAYSSEKDKLYPCNSITVNGEKYYFQCTRADIRSNIAHETYMRGIHGEPVTDRVSEKFWIENFGFERLDKDVEPDHIKDFATVATQKINKNCDKVLAVSKRVYDIAKDNGFNESKMIVSYIGTKVADRQIGCASASNMEYPLKVVFLGSDLFYEEKGYPFLMDALEKLEPKYARKIDLLLTVKQPEHAQMYRQLRNFHDVKIVNGYTHDDFDWIFDSAHLSIVPVLWEDNLPQIAIESVAYGVPVLASSAGGPSELTGSPKFKFECGNEEDFLNKLIHFVKNPDELKEYWNFHNGLVTLEEHIKELFKVYGLDKVNIDKMNFTIDMWKRLEKEYIFLKKKAEKPQAVYGTQQNGNNLQYISEISELTKQRDYLQYVIDETRKSKTYKIGRVITAIPRKIREKI